MAESIEVGVKFNPQGLDSLKGKLKSALGQASGEAKRSFQATGILPNFSTGQPNAQKPTSPNAKGGINWAQLALGLATSPFSTWGAARLISGSGIFGKGGGTNNIFGASGLSGFALAFNTLKASGLALKTTFDQLQRSVQIGSRLYQEAARTATNPETLFRLQTAFKAIGLSPEVANRMLQNVFLSKGTGIAKTMGSMNGTDMTNLIKGVGTGELADLQQIMNMGPEFKQAWDSVAQDSKIMAAGAFAMQQMAAHATLMQTAFHALTVEISQVAAPTLIKVMDTITDAIHKFPVLFATLSGGLFGPGSAVDMFQGSLQKKAIDWQNKILGQMGMPGFGQTGPHVPGTTRLQEAFKPQPRSEWERMGLIINGGIAGNDYAKQTATNTKRTADALVTMTKGPMGFLQGLPSASNMP